MKISHIILIALGLLLSSCEDRIEIDNPEGEVRFSVEGEITTVLKKHQLLITSTSDFDALEIPTIDSATATLFDDRGNSFAYENIGNGVYQTEDSIAGELNTAYHVKITLPNGKRIESDPELLTFITPIEAIFSAHVSEYTFLNGPPRAIDDEEEGFYVFIRAREKPTQGDGYRWKAFINGRLLNGPLEFFFINDDSFVDGSVVDSLDFNFLAQVGDTVVIEQTSISLRNVDYLLSLQTEANPDGQFGTPPAPVVGNFFNPDDRFEVVFGYFTASDVDSASIIIQERVQ